MIKNTHLVFILIVFLLMPSFVRAEVKLVDVVERIRPAVVTILTYDRRNKRLSQGSGFFINKKGHLITCYHVMKGAHRAEVKTYLHKVYKIKSVLAEDKANDLIKVQVEIPEQDPKWVVISKRPSKVAEGVVVIGSPLGLEQTVSEGIVSAVRKSGGGGNVYQISAPISPGSSGSPVVNMNGEIMGVASFQSVQGQNLNFAIPGAYVLKLKNAGRKNIAEWSKSKKKRIKITTGKDGVPVLTNK